MIEFKFNKKSAMFGLDARIALAIFGALSVITGAALYSAINKANVIAAAACDDMGLSTTDNGYQIMLFIDDDDAWGDTIGWWGNANCVAGKKCSAYIQNIIPKEDKDFALNLFEYLDAKIDNSDGKGKGYVRYYLDTVANGATYLHMHVMHVENPYG